MIEELRRLLGHDWESHGCHKFDITEIELLGATSKWAALGYQYANKQKEVAFVSGATSAPLIDRLKRALNNIVRGADSQYLRDTCNKKLLELA